ncbi:MAG: hypothetical protein ACUVUA_08845 [Chloroflexus sp.]
MNEIASRILTQVDTYAVSRPWKLTAGMNSTTLRATPCGVLERYASFG